MSLSNHIRVRKGEKLLAGLRTPEELSRLSWIGYFVRGNQRITNESREGARFPEIRLWDDWEQRQSHMWASDITTLLEVARLDISSWFWYPNGDVAGEAK